MSLRMDPLLEKTHTVEASPWDRGGVTRKRESQHNGINMLTMVTVTG